MIRVQGVIRAKNAARRRLFQALVLVMVGMVASSCGFKGMANVPIPGGPGTEAGSYTVYVQMPDTLAINGNSRVMVADVRVGTIRSIALKNWVATLTLGLDKSVKLPKNATAMIGQTSLLGSQHIELASPPNPSAERLKDGDTIPLKNSSAYPSAEQTLASVAIVLRGGNIPNLDVLQDEIYAIVKGRGDQIHSFLGKLDTFTRELNDQRDDITHAIDSTNRFLAYAGPRHDVLDRALTDLPPLITHLADTRGLLINAIESVGRLSGSADQYLSESRADIHTDLQSLQCPLHELGRGSPFLIGALKLIGTQPFDLETIDKAMRGDYLNVSLNLDLTYSSIDNAFLTGTGLSGSLRALEQSYGRDPETMIPDVRYTPNPNNAPGGPLVERAPRC